MRLRLYFMATNAKPGARPARPPPRPRHSASSQSNHQKHDERKYADAHQREEHLTHTDEMFSTGRRSRYKMHRCVWAAAIRARHHERGICAVYHSHLHCRRSRRGRLAILAQAARRLIKRAQLSLRPESVRSSTGGLGGLGLAGRTDNAALMERLPARGFQPSHLPAPSRAPRRCTARLWRGLEALLATNGYAPETLLPPGGRTW